MCVHARMHVYLHTCDQAVERPKLSFSVVHIFVKFAAEEDVVLAVFADRWVCEPFIALSTTCIIVAANEHRPNSLRPASAG